MGDLHHKLQGPDNDTSTIAYQEKINRSSLHKAASIVMRKQELARCIKNGMAAKFGEMMSFCDYAQAKSRELHDSGSNEDLNQFFEDMHQFATLAEAIKGVYCSIPQARFIAQEKINCLRVHHKSLQQTYDPFALTQQTRTQHSSAASV